MATPVAEMVVVLVTVPSGEVVSTTIQDGSRSPTAEKMRALYFGFMAL
jgi:hypothetical protein